MISKKKPEGIRIPLNFLVAAIRQVRLILKRGISPRKWELREAKLMLQAYQSGRTEGYANGFDEGYRKGKDAGKTEAATIISQVLARIREDGTPPT